jgi:hypothetical protein
VINVVEQFDAGGVDGLDDLHAPGGVVAHVVVVIDFAVEKLHANCDAVVLGDFFNAIQTRDGVFRAFVVGHAVAVSGEGDDVRNAGFGGERNEFAKAFFNSGVIFDAVHGAGNFAATGVGHAADEAISARHVVFLWIEKVDALQTDLSSVGAELV